MLCSVNNCRLFFVLIAVERVAATFGYAVGTRILMEPEKGSARSKGGLLTL